MQLVVYDFNLRKLLGGKHACSACCGLVLGFGDLSVYVLHTHVVAALQNLQITVPDLRKLFL